jgi:predicted O-methyltransferase YrrM
MKELLLKLELEYSEELKTQIPLLEERIDRLRIQATEKMPDIRRASDGKTAGTISYADMKVLYLLVRHFKPKAIFEIGTWIGTSAMVMAEAIKLNNNSGIVYTCDDSDAYLEIDEYRDTIVKITAYSDKALDQLPSGTKIDFIFADGEFTFATIKKIEGRLSTDAIITTHDYVLPAEKGVINYLRLQVSSLGGYELFSAREISEAIKSETWVGIMYKRKDENFFSSLIYQSLNLLQALFVGIRATFVRIYRKFSNYYVDQSHKGAI